MADVTDRDGKEAVLARMIAREFNRARLQLVGLIQGLEPWMLDVAPEFWAEHTGNLRSGISPLLSSTYLSQAATMMDDFEFLGVDWGLVNEDAVEWARNHVYDLVGELNKTSKRYLSKELQRINEIVQELQTTISDYFARPTTLGQLRDSLIPTFGPQRAEVIARTEVTRAASQGELAVAKRLEEAGIYMDHIWQTRNDEIVAKCPICWPRHNQVITDGFYPPGHPNCRCWWGQRIRSEE